jgi:DNA uptake protein ComE-like DNA-binding protein
VSQSSSWFSQTPRWVWLSLIPVFGGLSITYAGYKSKNNILVATGIGFAVAAFVLSGSSLSGLIWMAQIGSAFYLKKGFLAKTYPKTLPIPQEPELAKLVLANRSKIDINECSKNDLVNMLGIPIVYANNIELLLNEGYVFTHAEELNEIAGMPDNQVAKIAPMIVFSYNQRREADSSWRRLNAYTTAELVACGLDVAIAEKIVVERERKGDYKSLVEVKLRTGLPLSTYRHMA